jgi:hypothetical protein
MREEWRRWKDLVVASGIVLVLLASRAGGQVDVSFLPGDGSGTEAALLALEKSREALLDAREAIDAALKEVDLAMVSLEAASPRGKRREEPAIVEAEPRPSVAAEPRPRIEELRRAGEVVRGWGEAVVDNLRRRAWSWVTREENGNVAPAVARQVDDAGPAAGVSGGGAGAGEGAGRRDEVPNPVRIPWEALLPEKKAVSPAP